MNDYIHSSEKASADKDLNDEQMLKYLHNIFEDEAKRFIDKYSNIDCTIRIRQLLQATTFSSVVNKDWCNVNTALKRLRDTIINYAPRGPKSYGSEEAKVKYLYNAVSSIDWAKPVLTKCYPYEIPWGFQKLYTALDTSWVQEQREAKKSKSKSTTMDVLFGLQPTYGSPRQI